MAPYLNVNEVTVPARALECAKLNLTDPRARFHWEDVVGLTTPEAYDAVIMNPPFHSGRKGDPALGVSFIETATKMLTSQGTLWMVANRHLPYEATLRERFVNVDEVGGDSAFKIFRARLPIMQKARAVTRSRRR